MGKAVDRRERWVLSAKVKPRTIAAASECGFAGREIFRAARLLLLQEQSVAGLINPQLHATDDEIVFEVKAPDGLPARSAGRTPAEATVTSGRNEGPQHFPNPLLLAVEIARPLDTAPSAAAIPHPVCLRPQFRRDLARRFVFRECALTLFEQR